MSRSRALAGMAAAALCAAAPTCEGRSVPFASGQDAWLQVAGARFVEGPLPRRRGDVRVRSLSTPTDAARPGEVGKPLGGALDRGARALAVALEGDVGHWIAVAGPPDVETPELPSFGLELSFARDLPLGPRALSACALDEDGACGPPASRELLIGGGAFPQGALVVSLSWERDADLDLHVIDPDGVEIFDGDPTSWQPPPGPVPAGEPWRDAGVLDFDSNAACVIDGRRQENVVWERRAPPGRYRILVDAESLCGEPHAEWHVVVLAGGRQIARAEGAAYPTDAQLPHGRGAGVLALELELP